MRADPRVLKVGEQSVYVVGADDLAALKLASGRDQDVVDLRLLVAHAAVLPRQVVAGLERNDVARTAARTALDASVALARSTLGESMLELCGREPSPMEVAALSRFLDSLKEEGL